MVSEPAPERTPAVEPEAPPAVPQPEIGFHNRVAVRTAMLIAGISSLMAMIPLPSILGLLFRFVSLVAAGFIAVYLYQRRTGVQMTVRAGARMGWLTGVFCFLVALVTFALGTAVLAGQGMLGALWREQIRSQAGNTLEVQKALEMLDSPAGLATVILTTIIAVFLFFTSLPMIGGALCAKVLEKE